ncbi:MAG: glycosyltransferase family 2 protein [Planctomycetota bacterium]
MNGPRIGAEGSPGDRVSERVRRRLAIVVLNYRTPGLVLDCLDSLAGQLEPGEDEAVVVDNASPDDSADQIAASIAERGYGAWARLIRSPDNGGFSAGNNVGIRGCDAELYILLNSDTIMRPGAIAEIRRAAKELPDAGLIGPRLEWPDGAPQVSAFRDHSVPGQMITAAQTGPVTALLKRWVVAIGVPDEPVRADWVSFACVAVPRATFERVGLMDEGFFMYFEDAEFGRRVRAAGLEVWHCPGARVVHLRGGTAPVKQASRERKPLPRYYYRARARYFAAAGGRLRLTLANVAWTLGWLIAVGRKLVQGRVIGTPRRAPRDIWCGFRSPLERYRPQAKGSRP